MDHLAQFGFEVALAAHDRLECSDFSSVRFP